jgi:hypothetical protein
MSSAVKRSKKRKAIGLDSSSPLSLERVSDSTEVEAAVEHFFQEMVRADKALADPDKQKEHLKVVLLDLYATSYADPARYLSYSRDRSWYSEPFRKSNRRKSDRREPSRYEKVRARFTYQYTIATIDFLASHNYVVKKNHRHVPGDKSKSRRSRMKPTSKLMDVMQKHGVTLPMIKFHSDKETIILKGKKPKPKRIPYLDKDTGSKRTKKVKPPAKIIQYRDTPTTRRMRDNLKVINDLLDRHGIYLEIPDKTIPIVIYRMKRRQYEDFNDRFTGISIDFTRKRLHRTFVEGDKKFGRGGRFYGGWWIGVPKVYRQFIRIDSKPLVECDYSGIHANIAYALEGVPFPDDPYTLEGYDRKTYRKAFKKVFNAILNSDDFDKAVLAMGDRRSKALRVLPRTKAELATIARKLMDKHQPIKSYFHKGLSNWFQNWDSRLAERVMLAFAKLNRPILPIHDSFLVHHASVSDLQREMKIAFAQELSLQYDPENEEPSTNAFVIDVDIKHHFYDDRAGRLREAGKKRESQAYQQPATLHETLDHDPKRCMFWELQTAHEAYQDRLDKATRLRLAQQGEDPLEGMGIPLFGDTEPNIPEG